MQDAYPEATATGTVVLSAFTTKMAIYALARGFAGTEILIAVGTVMAMFPIFYAVIENDLRRVLAYSMNNQLGFMVVGIGIGTPLALDGAVAHAFADILFKALLFMSMGAVLLRAGTVNGSELGGLYKSMPLTTVFCIVGAASISAFPLFSAFVTKSLILEAAAREGHWIPFLFLLFASAGVFHHAGIKIPYFAFFAHDSGIRCQEAPIQHADRDGNRCRAVHRDRCVSGCALYHFALSGRFRSLHHHPHHHPIAIVSVVGAGVLGIGAHRHLPAGIALGESGFRLVLSPAAASCFQPNLGIGAAGLGSVQCWRGTARREVDRGLVPPSWPARAASRDMAQR
ncbi:MAG: proton-conducting transporter membrane subunit [Candidatus Competibacter sp.]